MIEAPDLSDLDPKDAKRVVTDYIVTLKRTRSKREELRTEFERWERRHDLAEALLAALEGVVGPEE